MKADNGASRHDDGKNRLDLLPPEFLWALAQVYSAGAKVYGDRDWERGMSHSKLVGCALRHLFKYLMGERYDTKPDAKGRPGTGCHHLAMVGWNIAALFIYDIRGIGIRDYPGLPIRGGDDWSLPTQVEPEAVDAKDD